jgi:hypothetical protein
MLPRKQPPQ